MKIIDSSFSSVNNELWIPHRISLFMNVAASLTIGRTLRQQTISEHYWPASETPFKWRFAGGPMLAGFYMFTGHVLFLTELGIYIR